MRLNVIFGSTSDEEKVLPGIERATEDIEGLEVRVHYASADNTPEKVERIVSRIIMEEHRKIPFISGAGMSNVLTGVVKRYATLNDLVIGIPIMDSETYGLSSFLSTSEKPPLNPVLAVGLNNSYAAMQIAHRFMCGNFGRVAIYAEREVVEEDDLDKIQEEFKNLGMSYDVVSPNEIESDDLILSPFTDAVELIPLDDILREGTGIQIGVICRGCWDQDYGDQNQIMDMEVTGIVTAGSYANAVQMVAQITQHPEALVRIKARKDKKAKDLYDHPGLLVVGGETKRYEGG